MRPLHHITATNFLSLAKVSVELQDLSVLVGPNGAGKSNFLKLIQFLGDTARLDLGPALALHGGFDAICFRGSRQAHVAIGVQARVTQHASDTALDAYTLSFSKRGHVLQRSESFTYKRTRGAGRRITAKGKKLEIHDDDRAVVSRELTESSAILSTLPRLGRADGGEQVQAMADLFQSFRVFEVDVAAARQPAAAAGEEHEASPPQLASNANNLAGFLEWLSRAHPETFALLVDDLRFMLPSLKQLHFEAFGGSRRAVALTLEERGLRGRMPLAAASFGTVRALALLAMLHDPNPPTLTCVEELDHGLHPYALDRVVERLRSAKLRTQLLVATHSPALVNRLEASELVVCERDSTTGATLLPAVDPREVAAMRDKSDLGLGELWFSGALVGVL